MSFTSRHWMRFVSLLALAISAVLVLSFGCGGSGDDDDDGGAATSVDSESATYDVTMTDDGNTPNDYSLPAGETLALNFSNEGAAVHNVRIAGADNEYYTADDAVSDPEFIAAGGSGKLVWTAPSEGGSYIFQCDFHPDLKGTIVVQ